MHDMTLRLVTGLYMGGMLAIYTHVVNGTLNTGLAIYKKDPAMLSLTGAAVSSAITALSGSLIFATRSLENRTGIKKDTESEKILKFAVPFLLSIACTPIISRNFNYQVGLFENFLYAAAGSALVGNLTKI